MPTIGYLSPFFEPAVGGAGIYVGLLGRELLARNVCQRFVVITERYRGERARRTGVKGEVDIVRVFPFRAGRRSKTIGSYLRYAVQNLQFCTLWKVVARCRIDTLFVHGSFFNNPTLLNVGLAGIRKRYPLVRFIVDLRDPKFRSSGLRSRVNWDAIISCSANISARLKGSD